MVVVPSLGVTDPLSLTVVVVVSVAADVVTVGAAEDV